MVNFYLTKHKISWSNKTHKLTVRFSTKTKRARLNDHLFSVKAMENLLLRDAIEPKHVHCIDLIISHQKNMWIDAHKN